MTERVWAVKEITTFRYYFSMKVAGMIPEELILHLQLECEYAFITAGRTADCKLDWVRDRANVF